MHIPFCFHMYHTVHRFIQNETHVQHEAMSWILHSVHGVRLNLDANALMTRPRCHKRRPHLVERIRDEMRMGVFVAVAVRGGRSEESVAE